MGVGRGAEDMEIEGKENEWGSREGGGEREVVNAAPQNPTRHTDEPNHYQLEKK